MDVLHACCAGLDVHKRSVVAGVLLTPSEGSVRREIRPFGTMTADLLALGDWLDACGVEQVAMESIGVFWRQCSIRWRTATKSSWSIPST